jgi:hypothetical protein
MVIKVIERGFVLVTYVDNADQRIGKVVGFRFTPNDGNGARRQKNAASQDLVFVSATGMRDEGVKRVHAGIESSTTKVGEGIGQLKVLSRAGRFQLADEK